MSTTPPVPTPPPPPPKSSQEESKEMPTDAAYEHNLFPEFVKCCSLYLQAAPLSINVNSIHNKECLPVLNLLPSSSPDKPHHDFKDVWIENAIRLSTSLDEMSAILTKEAKAYWDTREVLASLRQQRHSSNETTYKEVSTKIISQAHSSASQIESTVASFAAGTANQIEQLRKSIGDASLQDDLACHRKGVVAILVSRLRSEIVQAVQEIHRARMEDLQNIQEEEEEQKVEEVDPAYWEQEQEKNSPPEPAQEDTDYWEEEHKPESSEAQLYHRLHSSGGNVISVQRMPNLTNDTTTDWKEEQEYNPQLSPDNDSQQQLETMQIQNKDFQEIQKMEQTMMQITTLLNQFSALIEEQQDEIVAVHDKAKTSRENVHKGTENIVDATERGKRSRHYLAKFILVLGVILLFLNWITP